MSTQQVRGCRSALESQESRTLGPFTCSAVTPEAPNKRGPKYHSALGPNSKCPIRRGHCGSRSAGSTSSARAKYTASIYILCGAESRFIQWIRSRHLGNVLLYHASHCSGLRTHTAAGAGKSTNQASSLWAESSVHLLVTLIFLSANHYSLSALLIFSLFPSQQSQSVQISGKIGITAFPTLNKNTNCYIKIKKFKNH